MYIINSEAFRSGMRHKGYKSLGEFAKFLGVHRNTLYHYLSGKPVFPEQLERMLTALELRPEQVLQEKKTDSHFLKPLEGVMAGLQETFPQVSFVLFGSRAQGRARKYSDWDLGVYSRHGITHQDYRRMLSIKDELSEDLPFFVDLILLNRADSSFLKEASKAWVFLGGHLSDWMELQEKAFGDVKKL